MFNFYDGMYFEFSTMALVSTATYQRFVPTRINATAACFKSLQVIKTHLTTGKQIIASFCLGPL